MQRVRHAAGVSGTPNWGSVSRCARRSAYPEKDKSCLVKGWMATARRHPLAQHGLCCRLLESACSCTHVCAAATCIADRLRAHVCLLPCGRWRGRGRISGRSRPSLPDGEYAYAPICHMPAGATCGSHSHMTTRAAQATRVTCARSSVAVLNLAVHGNSGKDRPERTHTLAAAACRSLKPITLRA